MKKLLHILIILLCISCAKKENEELPANFEGYTYLPLKVGQELSYRVDSISYDDFTGRTDTIVYYLREVIESTTTDLSGLAAYRVAVFSRSTDSSQWRQIRIEERSRGTYRYERRENSISYIPMVFPPLEESRWNVNSLNNLPEVTYRYRNLHKAFSWMGKSYDSTITVLQKDQLNLIGREFEREVYASGVGLVFKESINLATDINSGQITSGYERRVRLVD